MILSWIMSRKLGPSDLEISLTNMTDASVDVGRAYGTDTLWQDLNMPTSILVVSRHCSWCKVLSLLSFVHKRSDLFSDRINCELLPKLLVYSEG